MSRDASIKRLENNLHSLLKDQKRALKLQKEAWKNLQSIISENRSRLSGLASGIDSCMKNLCSFELKNHKFSKSNSSIVEQLLYYSNEYGLLSEEICNAVYFNAQATEELLAIRYELEQVEAQLKIKLAAVKSQRLPRGLKLRELAIHAGIPKKYLDNFTAKRGIDGTISFFFGGEDKPGGPGHAHYVLTPERRVRYRREPNAPHGWQNYVLFENESCKAINNN